MRVPSVDRQTFLANLRQSGLLGADQWQAVAGSLPDTSRGRVLARALVERGLLTRFQAEQLLQGKYRGFSFGGFRFRSEVDLTNVSHCSFAGNVTVLRPKGTRTLSGYTVTGIANARFAGNLVSDGMIGIR